MPVPQPTARSDAVAVVIAAYNAESTLAAALASVAGQSQPPGAVVVVDDGSQDDTSAIARQWSGLLPLEVIHLPRNEGLASARRRAIAAVPHQLIAILDSDDVWLPDHLAVLTAAYDHEGTIVSGDGLRWLPGARIGLTPYGADVSVPPVGEQKREILRRDFVFVGCLFDRGSYERAGGYRPEIVGAENWDLWIRMVRSGAIVRPTGVPTYLYRTRSDSLSRSVHAFRGNVTVLERALEEISDAADRHVLRHSLRRYRAQLNLYEAYAEARRGCSSAARRRAVRSLAGGWRVKARAAGMVLSPLTIVRLRDRKAQGES